MSSTIGFPLSSPRFPAATGAGNHGGYLFTTFRGETSPLTEQVYFGFSEDGVHWRALNGGDPVLVSSVGEGGVRDPFVIRSPDGARFYLLATDLSIFHNRDWQRAVRAGSQAIVIWESVDLVHWSPPRLVTVAMPDAGCTWAPEAVWDEKRSQYLVFWASTTGREYFQQQRIWAAYTPDFHTFGETFLYQEGPHHIIDTSMVYDGQMYYRFSKDERHSTITMECGPSPVGEWRAVSGFNLGDRVGYEGPFCYRLPGGQWCLLLDHFAKGLGYEPFLTSDLATGHFASAPQFEFPFQFRHGSVLQLNAAEASRLLAGWGQRGQRGLSAAKSPARPY